MAGRIRGCGRRKDKRVGCVIDPRAKRGAACMFSGGEFIEAGALRRKMHDEIERLHVVESCERFGDFVF